MKSKWIEKDPYIYVDAEGYEILVEEETDPDRGNPTGRWELNIWLAKGGYYECISTHDTFNDAVKAQKDFIKENN